MDDIFTDLLNYTHAELDRTGEAHFSCPACGHPSSPRLPHCSFNTKGWHCFVCGAGGSLPALAHSLGLGDRIYQAPAPTVKKEKPVIIPDWQRTGEPWIRGYENHPLRFRHWMAHKPLAMQTIKDARLGVGILPPKWINGGQVWPGGCQHERLIVPSLSNGRLLGLRGRRFACNCEGKWIAAFGTSLDSLPLYNERSLASGKVVFIVENLVDALLITQETDYAAVGIYSTTYWKESWAVQIKANRPELVIVALDNDLVGNGGGCQRQKFEKQWRETHNNKVPKSRGAYVANQLNRIGVKAILWDWKTADYKSDIGDLIMQGVL